MKTRMILFLMITLTSFVADAQTYTLNWGTSFNPAWVTGAVSGNANNVNGSGVRCTATLVKTGGIYTTTLGSLGGVLTPTVAGSTFVVPGSSNNLLLSLDYT